MKKLQPNKNNIIYSRHTPVANYLAAKDQLNNRLWTINKAGRLVTKYNGVFLTDAEFQKVFPVPKSVSFTLSPQNADTTKSYLL